jgi:hypothetical protein
MKLQSILLLIQDQLTWYSSPTFALDLMVMGIIIVLDPRLRHEGKP